MSRPDPSLEPALTAWRQALGPSHVVTDAEILAAVGTATFATHQRVPAVLRPANLAEVQECLRIANRFRVPLSPTSRGKNWGLGSRVPVRDGDVVLDLGRLDRIVDFSEELGYLTVEPGVTFGQAAEFLTARGSKLMVSVIGGSPDASLIGNALERGHGIGPLGDRFAHTCGLEVVLPSGECVHTGFERFTDAKTARLHRWGVGPHLDGLFSQSNLGVVTRMTIWLSPRPADMQIVRFSIKRTARLAALVDALRPLRTDDQHYLTLRSAHRLRAGAQGLLARAVHRMAWHGAMAIYSSSPEEGAARRRRVRRLLADHVDSLQILGEREFSLVRLARRPLAMLGFDADMLADAPRSLSILGTPNHAAIESVYRIKPAGRPASRHDLDPDRDRCGILWCTPTLPFVGADVVAVWELIRDTARAHQCEPDISLCPMSWRSIDAVVGLLYDREQPGADERAMACWSELQGRLNAAGYPPYRLGTYAMQSLPAVDDASPALLRTLKQALDPNDILSPGRYDARHLWPEEPRS